MSLILPSQGPLITPSPDVVRTQVEELYSTARRISTTQTVEVSLVITIPVHWNTYDLHMWASCDTFEDVAAAANDIVVYRLRRTDVSGTIWGKATTPIGIAAPDDQRPMAFLGIAVGETTTGAVTVVLTSDSVTEDLKWAMDNIVMIVHAYQIT